MLHSDTKEKVDANYVARETINAIKENEHCVFPDPHLKDIYAIIQGHKEIDMSDIKTVIPSLVNAA